MTFFARIHFVLQIFPSANYLTGRRYFIHKTGIILPDKLVKKSMPFVYYPNGNEMDTPRTRVCAIYRAPLGCHVNLIRSDLFIYPSHWSVDQIVGYDIPRNCILIDRIAFQ